MAKISNQGVEVHYKVVGEGPPLLMVYGTFGSCESWFDYDYVERLRANYRLILIDLRGHGDSGKPHNSDSYSVDLFVQDAIAVLDELGVRVCHTLGISFGGWIIFSLWRKHPERIKSMILLDGVPGPEDSALTLESTDKIEELVSNNPELTPDQKERFLLNFDKLALQSLARGIADDIPKIIDDIIKLPENINLDCLILTSDFDGVEMDLMKKIESSITNASLITLGGFSHRDLFVRSDKTIPHILHFLNAQVKGSGS